MSLLLICVEQGEAAGVRVPLRVAHEGQGPGGSIGDATARKLNAGGVVTVGPPVPNGFRFARAKEERGSHVALTPPEPTPTPPRGREGAHAPISFDQMYTFGFNSDYYCSGRISDEPRRMRLSCTKNPPRTMNCMCDHENANTLLVPCRCEPALTSTKKKINLIDKFVGT